MKVTLWQQFSSNHSAMYTIMGVFSSSKDAQIAGKALTKVVTDAANWSKAQNDNHSRSNLSPIEEHYATKFNISWQEPVDWLHPFPQYFAEPYQRQPHEHVITHENIVFVAAPGGSSTWQTGHHFVDLISALGGKPFKSIYMGQQPDTPQNKFHFTGFVCNLICTAPDVNVAINIEQILKSYVDARTGQQGYWHWQQMPWAIYHPLYHRIQNKVSREEYSQYETDWIKEHRLQHQYFLQNRDANYKLSDKQQLEYQKFIKQDIDVAQHIEMFRRETEFITEILGRIGQGIKVQKADASYFECAFPALVGWMQSQGCIVEYEFEQGEEQIG